MTSKESRERTKMLLQILRKQDNCDELLAGEIIRKKKVCRAKSIGSELTLVMEIKMNISYKKLFKLLIDKDMNNRQLSEKSGVSMATLTKMRKGEGAINIDAWDKICRALNCSLNDIIEIVPTRE